MDWYSLGLVLLEMLTGHNPFKNGGDEEVAFVDQMNKILTTELEIPDWLTTDCQDLLKQLLIKLVSFFCYLFKIYSLGIELGVVRVVLMN